MWAACRIYPIAICIPYVFTESTQSHWILSVDMGLLRVSSFWKAKTLWTSVKRFFDISYLFKVIQTTAVSIYFVANKAKERISKRVFQENKARQIFRKTDISYPLIRTHTCAYQGVRNVRFSEKRILKTVSPFCLITDDLFICVCQSIGPSRCFECVCLFMCAVNITRRCL